MSKITNDLPGKVIHHVPAATRNYIGCPSIVVFPSGDYAASHSYFGPGATNSDSFVYGSSDRGKTWRRISDIHGQIWSELFLHEESLYIIGTDHCDRHGSRLNGRMVIRRSDDRGRTWTEVEGASKGLLSDRDGYHTAPTPLVVHRGRIWKGFEFAPDPDRKSWTVFVISASVDADLLNRESWTFSRHIKSWPDSQWIEGNMVVSPDGELLDVLRTNNQERTPETDEPAAIVHVSENGADLSHNSVKDRVLFPGGGTKFTIRRDPISLQYLALVNPQHSPDLYRNVLSLSASTDLVNWKIVRELIRHPDPIDHGFQYVDWDFDGEDIVYVSRTAFDDGLGGAHRAHDANYLTFGRIEAYRNSLTMGGG